MNLPLTLPTTPPEHPALDYAALRREGIRHLERLTGQLWTDYNTHDPGITILEQLCYALTDLAYRINYEIPDLLQGDGQQANDSFFSPAEILNTRPATVKDLRKLLIDIRGIKNAWVEVDTRPLDQPDFYYNAKKQTLDFAGNPLTDDPVFLKGLYRALVEFEDTLHLEGRGPDRDAAWQAVLQRLHSNRGLGEDFARINRLETQYVQVLAHVEIAAVDSPEEVLLGIYRQLSEHISPSVPFYTLSQMLERGQRVDEIFDGPLLNHGFIHDEDLEQARRRTVLRTSDLIQAIMDAPGVKAVRYLKLGADQNTPITDVNAGESRSYQTWSLNLDAGRAAKFDVTRSAIILERTGLKVQVDEAGVRARYKTNLQQVMERGPLPPDELDFQPPPGRDRGVGSYYSIQHQFPATYGIGSLGLPASATPQRHAQAKQLKAYLLFFDQLLANYFAQLSHVKDLFSFYGDSAQTYFAAAIDDPGLGLDGLRKEGHAERLQTISNEVDSTYAAAQRRNRFLNHLLARFAEQFTDYALLLYDARADQQRLIQDKQTFLQQYPELSSARGTAYNYLQPRSETNRSGLEKRIQHKLGLHHPDEDFILVEHILLRPMTGDKGQTRPILAESSRRDPYSLRLSFVFPKLSAPSIYARPGFKEFVARTVRQESPAHLSVDVQWLEPDRMAVFKLAYEEWLDQRRIYWAGASFSQENVDDIR